MPRIVHAITESVTKPLSGSLDLVRDVSSLAPGPAQGSTQPLYKEIPDYNENGALVGSHSELTDYGKQVDAGKTSDPVSRLILGLDAYNNATDVEDQKNRLPHTFLGNTASGVISIAPDIAMTALLPEEKAAEATGIVGKLKAAVFSPFNKVAGTRNFLSSYGEARAQGKGEGAAAVAGGESAADIAMMGVLGGVAGDVLSPKIYKTLTESGLVKGGKITQMGVDAATDAAVFGAYPVAKDMAMGKPVNADEVESGFGMGLLFGGLKALKTHKEWTDAETQLKNVWADRYAMAAQNFMNASPESISDVHNMNTTDSDLFAQASDFAAKAKEEPDLNKKKAYIAQASTLAKMSDVKGSIDAILHDPINFVKSVRDSDLPGEQKIGLLNKIVDVYKRYGAGTGEEAPLLSEVQREASITPQQPALPPAAPAGEPAAAEAPAPTTPMEDLDAELDRFKQAKNEQLSTTTEQEKPESGNNSTTGDARLDQVIKENPDRIIHATIPGDQKQAAEKHNVSSFLNESAEPIKTNSAKIASVHPDGEGGSYALVTAKSQTGDDIAAVRQVDKNGNHVLGLRDDGWKAPFKAKQYFESLTNKEEPTNAVSQRIATPANVDETSRNSQEVGAGISTPEEPANARQEVQNNGEEQQAAVGRQPEGEYGLTSTQAEEKPYYINKGTQGFEETPGKPVKNDHGLDLFSHDLSDNGGKGFAVSEGSTGLQIAKGQTEEEAVANATEALSKKTPEEMQAIINKQHENGIKSPRGIVGQKAADAENTEAVIAQASATVGKAKATTGGRANTAGVVDEIDNNLESVGKELKLAGYYDTTGATESDDTETGNKRPEKNFKADLVKYSKALAKELGYEHDSVTKGKKTTIVHAYTNVPPAGGDGHIILWKPDSAYGVYIGVDVNRDYPDDNLTIDNNVMWRVITPENKYTGFSNNWIKSDVTSTEFAKQIKRAVDGYDKQSGQESSKAEEPKNTEEPQTERQKKRAQHEEELKAAKKAFMATFNKIMSGVNPETIEKGIKLLSVYAKIGMHDFGEIVRDLHEELGAKVKDVFEGLKAAYGAFATQEATDEQLDNMTDLRAVRKATFEDLIKEAENETRSESNGLEKNASGVDANEPAGKPAGAPQEREAGSVPNGNGKPGGAAGSEPAQQGNAQPRGGERGGAGGDNAGKPESIAGQPAERVGAGSTVSANAKKRELAPEDRNHIIRPEDTIVPQGQVAKFNANVDAIMLLRKLEKEDRNPSPAEKQTLAKFVGWGGLAKYLETSNNWGSGRAIEAAINGANETVYTSNYASSVRLNFKEDGPLDMDKYDNFSDAVDAVRKRLQNANYAVSPDDIRPIVLKAIMSSQEHQAAVNSTINAHYTERSVISNMWDIMRSLGFKGGNVLEPSAGIGHFFGLMPQDLQENSSLRAHELETVTGRIMKKLYPEAKIAVEGFEHSRIAPNSQDLVIGNVPFAQSAPYDKNYPELSKFSMHNYFIAKSLKQLKPGGVAALITSQSSMDANASAKFRDWVSSPNGGNSYMVGAIRLPSNAFDENAGTQVTTDMLVFQKRGTNNDPELAQPFRYTKFLKTGKDSEGNDVPLDVNEYYHNNPGQMLGEMMTAHEAGTGGLYGSDSATLKAPENFNLPKAMSKAAEAFPKDIIGERQKEAEQQAAETITGVDKKEGSVFEKGGKIFRVENGDGVDMKADSKQAAIAKSYVSVKTNLLDLIAQEQSETPDKDIEALRSQLNKEYDTFVKKYGTINNNRTLSFLDENDIDFPLLTALEDVTKSIETVGDRTKVMLDIKKSDILKKRVNFPRTEPQNAKDIADAIGISLNYRNGLDVGYIARMLGDDVDAVRARLVADELAYENPDNGLLETPDQYLSGDDIRGKLARAESAAEQNPMYRKNVEQLKKVQPEDIPSALIEHNLGAGWIPPHIYQDFARHLLDADVQVQYVPLNGSYIVKVQGGKNNAQNLNTYSGGGISALDLLDDCLNSRQTIAYDYIDKKSVKNPQRTAEAQAAQAALQDEFKNFIDTTPAAQKTTEQVYNERFNNVVERKWRTPDYAYYPGASQTISLREHQKRAVARNVTESTLNAHSVGTGKTFTIITTAMEQRRLGTAKKPLIAVYNATLGQFVAAAKQLYPAAKILAPSRKEMEAAGRQRLFSKIALGDWDMIILPHSQVDMISDDPERQRAYIQEQIDEMRGAQSAAIEAGDKRISSSYNSDIKALEKELAALSPEEDAKGSKVNVKNEAKKALKIEASLSKALDRKTDQILNFEQMGIDAIHLDEAHDYKKLGFSTSMQNIRGIDTQRSKKAQSMYLKTRWVQEKTGGKNVSFYTGTPISNTLAEVWTFMRYLRPQMLQRMGIQHFDQFASTFGQVIPSLEQRGSGQFAIQNRFAKFQNLPELMRAFRSMTDVVLSSDVKEFVENNTLPKITGGKPNLNILQQSSALKRKIQEFRDTLDWFDSLSGKEKREYSWIPVVIHGRAKQAAIDLRLLNPEAEDSLQSKSNATVERVLEKWKATKANKGTILVFSDRYQSSDVKNKYLDEEGQIVNEAYGKPRFNMFEDMKKKLVAKGIPAGEIEIVTDSKYDNPDRKAALFDKVNSGDVRVVMGTTPKMGVGVNAQKKASMLINMDAPDRPMDYEQRLGRVIRQGNENKQVDIENMGVENTLDSGAYKRLSVKDQFIRQIMKGEGLERVMGDPADEDVIPYEEIMAQLSDSPYAMKKVLVDNALKSEQIKQKSHSNKVIRANSSLQSTERELKQEKSLLRDHLASADMVRQHFGDDNEITSLKPHDGAEATDKFGKAADEYIQQLIERAHRTSVGAAMGIVTINGVKVHLEIESDKAYSKTGAKVEITPHLYYTVPDLHIRGNSWAIGVEVPSNSGVGFLASFRSQLQNVLVRPARTQERIDRYSKDVDQLTRDLDAKFDDTKLKALQKESEELKEAMIKDSTEKKAKSAAEFITDQSNIKPALDFLDKLKAKNDGRFMSTIIPIPPAVWNGAIDVMKNILKTTNSTQKAIRVAAQYIINKGGSEAQAKDFESTMATNIAETKIGKQADAPDSEEEGPVSNDALAKSAGELQSKLRSQELSPNEEAFAHVKLDVLTRKELNRYIEVASILSVDPEGVVNKDITDLMDRVANRMNPKSGTAVPPPAPPDGGGGETSPEDDEPRKRIPKKDKLPMDGTVEDLPTQTDAEGRPIAKDNYSAFGRLKDIRVRNLEQLKQYGVDNGDLTPLRLTKRYATSKAQAQVIMKTTTQRIVAAIGKDGYVVLRQALMESRLRGVKQRFLNWAENIRKTSDEELDDMFAAGKQSMMYDIVSQLDGYEDDPKPEQTVLGLISNQEFDDAREYMSDMFENAAGNVAFFDKLANGKTFDSMVEDGKFKDAGFQEAMGAYKSLLEDPFKESHAENEGIFSDALGPLDTYYPLTPTGADAHYVAKPGNQYRAPENPNNKFTTGQGQQYSSALADLSNKLSNAIRTSNKARAISSLENAGLIARVTKDTPDDGFITVNGELYTAKKVEVAPSRLIYKEGETSSIPARYVMMPNWLYKELKPIFENIGDHDDFSLFGRINNLGVKLMLGGPIEATSHSYRLLGGIVNSMPYMQEWAYKNGVLGHAGGLALNNPFVKTFVGMGKILFTDISSDEALQTIQEMAKLGVIPEKTWQKTWSKEFAELTNAKKVPLWDWSPVLYGKHSIDLKARVLLYRLTKAMNPDATPEQVVDMQNELGNYTMSLQGELEKFVKKHGLAPFYSFGGAIYRSGIKAVFGQSNLPLTRPSLKEAFTTKMGAEQMSKFAGYKMAQLLSAGIVGLVAYWALVYQAQTGKLPWKDKRSKLLKLPFPESAKNAATRKMFMNKKSGEWDDIDFSFFNPFLNRGIRAVGAPKAYETAELGGTAGQAAEAGFTQAVNTNLSPYTSSPALQLGFTTLTGDAPYITGLRDKYTGTPGPGFYRKVKTFPGMGQIGANAAVAATGINPLIDYAVSPLTKALKFKYGGEDQDAWTAATSVFNTIVPHLTTPHGNDEAKARALAKQQKAIHTSMKKEGTIKEE